MYGTMSSFKAPETTFYKVEEKVDFPKEEEKILKYWDEINAFKKSIELSVNRPVFTFYDGPPFATGLPHYGHILAGSIKDVVTRYAYQTGHHVERKFGWDCHGLPIEHEIDKMYNIKGSADVHEMGIDVYNEKCRSVVMKYSFEWRHTICRTGRWIDFDNDYKTLNTTYMETLWWIFKQLYEKKLVYRGFQVMPYSLSCATPVSNFEANLNYKMVTDPSFFVAFTLVDEPLNIVAWTTTPWTLPSNLVLCVNEEFNYVKVHNKKLDMLYVIAECRLEYFAGAVNLTLGEDLVVVENIMGKDLVGKHYVPLFDYFSKDPNFSRAQLKRSYVVVSDKMVTSTTGTGIVHCAPYHGEEDFRVCKKYGLLSEPLPDLLDEHGYFKNHLKDIGCLYVKNADNTIKKLLKEKGSLVHSGTIVHSYPFCWRSDTPLIYRAVNSWFIKVEEYRDKILKASEETNWVPRFVKDKRFHNWISEARDWCISRNRFWGTPIPIWASEDYSQLVCIGSIEELEKYTEKKVTDLHRHHVDNILIPDPRGSEYPPLKRIPEIFDCWYESGSMPLAKIHYPFEHEKTLHKHFPANFIAEGLDQTRGWFYTLMIISTHLFDKAPFKNVIVNGLILASDGKKMSKRLKNYPDPLSIIKQYGADSLRLFLTSSPAVKAEPVRFTTEGVRSILKDIILPWYHAYRFFVQEVTRLEATGTKFVPDSEAPFSSPCIMDRWIYSITQDLIDGVHTEMESYKLYNVMPKLLGFLEQLTNWYIRINRDRMRGSYGEDEALMSLRSLYASLVAFTKLMSMFAPFTSEMIYMNLKRATGGMESIHFELLPKSSKKCDNALLEKVSLMQKIIVLGRNVRERKKVSLKSPLKSLTIIHEDLEVLASLTDLLTLIKEELNVIDVNLSNDTSCISLSVVPNFKVLGSKLGKDMKVVGDAIKKFREKDVLALEAAPIEICGHQITLDDVVVSRNLSVESFRNANLDGASDKNVAIILDFTTDDTLQYMAMSREIANRVQKTRKTLGLSIDDDITICVQINDRKLLEEFEPQTESLRKVLRKPVVLSGEISMAANIIHEEDMDVRSHVFKISISRN
ncbi:isoleucyl-tRNA synthetase, putative [Theileria equi strain WA]|uniref:isoleucine--tRNA ligase n=1 Tax=Theileria equi strain WA TaxID=1537102 RepID=L0AW94_THEEQ|nr:isoleucyl-tRNA synthetase, putative [Theileria equi strain WA]AFZ79174.1 isoleucyl-tRNA synthetase, putative [Theileria equi strain WA]|eukprot:XP_004828840.1 isoleucyl-tRNA synthetase, putative [Theileria equi strain WA]